MTAVLLETFAALVLLNATALSATSPAPSPTAAEMSGIAYLKKIWVQDQPWLYWKLRITEPGSFQLRSEVAAVGDVALTYQCSCCVTAELVWKIDSAAQWQSAAEASEHLELADGRARPTAATASYRSALRAFPTERS